MILINNLVEFAEATGQGVKLEHFHSKYEKWSDADYIAGGDSLKFIQESIDSGLVRVKEEAKIIPLDILIDSGIDCEFSYEPEFTDIRTAFYDSKSHKEYITHQDHHYRHCRPRMNHWHTMFNIKGEHYNLLEWVDDHFLCSMKSKDGAVYSFKDIDAEYVAAFCISGVKTGFKLGRAIE